MNTQIKVAREMLSIARSLIASKAEDAYKDAFKVIGIAVPPNLLREYVQELRTFMEYDEYNKKVPIDIEPLMEDPKILAAIKQGIIDGKKDAVRLWSDDEFAQEVLTSRGVPIMNYYVEMLVEPKVEEAIDAAIGSKLPVKIDSIKISTSKRRQTEDGPMGGELFVKMNYSQTVGPKAGREVENAINKTDFSAFVHCIFDPNHDSFGLTIYPKTGEAVSVANASKVSKAVLGEIKSKLSKYLQLEKV